MGDQRGGRADRSVTLRGDLDAGTDHRSDPGSAWTMADREVRLLEPPVILLLLRLSSSRPLLHALGVRGSGPRDSSSSTGTRAPGLCPSVLQRTRTTTPRRVG